MGMAEVNYLALKEDSGTCSHLLRNLQFMDLELKQGS